MEYFIFEYISFSTGPAANSYECMRFSVCLWLSQVSWYGMAKWTSSPRWVSPNLYNSKFYLQRSPLFYRTKWRNGLIFVRYGSEPISLVNRSLTHIFYAYLLWCNGSISFFMMSIILESQFEDRETLYTFHSSIMF